ncbi:MAG: N-formylglutamate amidohydrolase [Betaproteobacteria bacterium]
MTGPSVLKDAFIVTCEHGGNRIPAPYRSLFRAHAPLLATHRGYDPGALVMARALAQALDAPLVHSTVSRLLVDLNRSISHPQLFSVATLGMPATLHAQIVARYYLPYRTRVEALVNHAFARGRRVIHVSSHSFTPALDGQVRRADVGLLYDPRRAGEATLAARWKASLEGLAPTLKVRRNYPYAGKGDGLTSYLRRRFSPRAYVGMELEVNQKIVYGGGRPWTTLRTALVESLLVACRRHDVESQSPNPRRQPLALHT